MSPAESIAPGGRRPGLAPAKPPRSRTRPARRVRNSRAAAEAIEHYESAHRLGLDRAELYQNLGSALVDSRNIGGAIDAYRQAIERNPEDATTHRDLNKLLWEQELLDSYLDSYRNALDQRPGSVQLRLDYAMALNQKEEFEEAELADEEEEPEEDPP